MAFILTKKIVIVLGVVAGLAVTGAGVNYVVMPAVTDIALAQEEVTSAKDEVSQMQQRLAGLQQSQQQFPAIEAIDKDLEAKFPSTIKASLLDALLEATLDSGMGADAIQSLEFSPPTLVVADPAAPAAGAPAEGATQEGAAPVEAAQGAADAAAPIDGATQEGGAAAPQTSFGTGFAEVAFSASVKGSPAQIEDFLKEINGSSRAIILSQISVNDAEGEVTLALTGKAYLSRLITAPSENVQATTPDATGTDEVIVDQP